MVAEAFKTIRSYHGRIAVITQSLAGIQAIYGRETTRTLLSNAGAKIVMATDDRETADYVSDKIGDRTRLQASRSFDQKSPLTSSASVREEDARLIRSEHVSRMDRDKLVILRTRLTPIMADKMRWFEDPWFREIQGTHSGPYPGPETNDAAADETGRRAAPGAASGRAPRLLDVTHGAKVDLDDAQQAEVESVDAELAALAADIDVLEAMRR